MLRLAAYIETFRHRLPIVALLLALTPLTPVFGAQLIFAGSGTGTSGQAIAGRVSFEFVQHNFGSGNVNAVEITISNMAPVTLLRGNLITGVFFTLPVDVGALPTGVAGFDGVAPAVVLANGTTVTNVDLGPAVANTSSDGTFQLSNGPFGIANSGVDYSLYRYGISTVGGGLVGFSGTAVNGDDYGIFAAGSNVTSGGLASARPLISTSATFWIARPTEWVTLGQLGPKVRLGYGSQPDNSLEMFEAVPEPGSYALAGGGLLLAAFLRKRRAPKQ